MSEETEDRCLSNKKKISLLKQKQKEAKKSKMERPGKLHVCFDTSEAWMNTSSILCGKKDLDGKCGDLRLDGLEVYQNYKELACFLSCPAEIQIYADPDVTEFSIVLGKDHVIYRSSEVPEFIQGLAELWLCELDHLFKQAVREMRKREQQELELKKKKESA